MLESAAVRALLLSLAAGLSTLLGALVIRGRGLHIDRIDDQNGEVAVTGEIVALLYDETRFKGGFLARLLR